MQTVVIVIHLMVVVALIGFVLLQKSEGGGLGIGSTGGFMTSRGTTNVLTRTTAVLAGGVLRHQPGPVDPGRVGAQAAHDHTRRHGRADRTGQSRRAAAARRAGGGVLDQLRWWRLSRRPAGAERAAGPALPIDSIAAEGRVTGPQVFVAVEDEAAVMFAKKTRTDAEHD